MKVCLLLVGKTGESYLEEAIAHYQKRLQHYLDFSTQVVPALKNTKHLSQEEQKEKEGKLLLKQIKPGDQLVLLDENGKQYSSLAFAQYLERKSLQSQKNLVFAVGGPYGFSPEVYAAATEKVALSQMTFSHQMVRLFFVEQLYRAMSILNNEPYHHG